MAKEKSFKCAFCHCEHEGGRVSETEAVKINQRYWHRDCYEISQIIQTLVDDYMNTISSTVVVSLLRKIINNIVFGKKLHNDKIPKNESDLNAALYLEFAFQFAINHNIPITHPQGLYYLIDDRNVKEAWKKKKEAEIQREAAKNVDVSESNQTSFTINQKKEVGFGDIFGGLID